MAIKRKYIYVVLDLRNLDKYLPNMFCPSGGFWNIFITDDVF